MLIQVGIYPPPRLFPSYHTLARMQLHLCPIVPCHIILSASAHKQLSILTFAHWIHPYLLFLSKSVLGLLVYLSNKYVFGPYKYHSTYYFLLQLSDLRLQPCAFRQSVTFYLQLSNPLFCLPHGYRHTLLYRQRPCTCNCTHAMQSACTYVGIFKCCQLCNGLLPYGAGPLKLELFAYLQFDLILSSCLSVSLFPIWYDCGWGIIIPRRQIYLVYSVITDIIWYNHPLE